MGPPLKDMLLSLIFILIASLFPVLLILTTFALSSRSALDREKTSPFECGFDPQKNARIPFSLRFFLLAVIFLVFDIEIVLLLPVPLAIRNSFLLPPILLGSIFLIILLLGLIHEWHEGSLNWAH